MNISKYGIYGSCTIIIMSVLLACSRTSTPEPQPNNPPQITSVSPAHGGGGTTVTVSGTGFSTTISENEVLFNGKPAIISQATANQLMVTVPSLAGSGAVQVTSRGKMAQGPTPLFLYEFKYMVSTFAGNYTTNPLDGTGTNAGFGALWGLTADSLGNLFVADGSFNLVRKVTTNAVVSTYAGAGSLNASIGIGTHFYYPIGVGVDKNGIVYVADWGLNRIRKITAVETVTTVAVGFNRPRRCC